MFLSFYAKAVQVEPRGNVMGTPPFMEVDVTLTDSQAIELLHGLSSRLDVSHFERMVREMKEAEAAQG